MTGNGEDKVPTNYMNFIQRLLKLIMHRRGYGHNDIVICYRTKKGGPTLVTRECKYVLLWKYLNEFLNGRDCMFFFFLARI